MIIFYLATFHTTYGWRLINLRKCPGPVRRLSTLLTEINQRSVAQAFRTLRSSYVPEGPAAQVATEYTYGQLCMCTCYEVQLKSKAQHAVT
jgi:hypothetical protein